MGMFQHTVLEIEVMGRKGRLMKRSKGVESEMTKWGIL